MLQNSLMAEVTKLTSEGRLTEATSLLRSMHSIPQSGPEFGRETMPDTPLHLDERCPGRFEWRSHSGESGTLRYKIYIPSGRPVSGLPVVVMLHGCKQTPDDFGLGTGMNLLAEEKSFLAVYPAQTGQSNVSRCWNWFQKNCQHRERGEPDLIAGLTRKVCAEFSADTSKVYIAGLSAGGAAAANIGLLYPDVFASIGVHSGLASGAASDLPSALAAMRGGGATTIAGAKAVPTIVFHGDGDSTVNVINARQVSQQATEGLDTYVVTDKGSFGNLSFTRTIHTLDSGVSMLEEWIVHGGSHAWFGGDPRGTYTTGGPDASREMCRFFFEHRLASVARNSPKSP